MQVIMQHAERLRLAEMREFLDASNTLSFADAGRKQIYGLRRYEKRRKKGKKGTATDSRAALLLETMGFHDRESDGSPPFSPANTSATGC